MSTAGNGSPGMRMGRPFGIPVYVSPTWLIVAGLITVVVQPQVADGLPGHSEPVTYAVALIFAVLLYLSVLLHELAHCVVAKRYGLPVRRITLYMLGGVSEIEREPETAGREFAIAFAGPLVSLGLAGVGYALSEFVLPPYGVLSVLVWELWTSNLIVGVFNLLPGLPLDGGRILRAAVWKVAGSSVTGTTVAAWVGRALAVAVISIPLLFYLMAGQPPSIWGLVWTLILASFIWMGASQALRVARVRARLPQLRARLLARRAIEVTADVPLSEALRRAQEAGAGAVVIVDHEGRPTAIVNEAAVNATPEHRRPWISVGAVARTLEPALVLGADLEGESLLDAMRNSPAGEYLLVERGGEIYGVLATSDVNRVFTGV
ncbi:site-2 protease family protein [Thermobispora bispora]|jgi:Zn-dependent protease|uniref:Zinc metalloprotease n=1 Tax=Thermobispora bispora (strain ATCC 19993 / DSM 43833 / CBS 139.67 / JCM 10125 / KCTC 9307 / NBRC 14880 / R51) TaxID=469371 RepID=D6YBJ5_THEBD|nr:site-2 protease family protein [Thermobispora bispora]ADG88555.1 peptidase M50 [Thermobispora bispora DSM 43833]MDI9579080.1 site-2 protease family protein [Thermobispora sp.]